MIGPSLTSVNHLYFTGLIERGSASLSFQVAIAPDYPSSSPVFALSLRWKNERTALNDEGIRVRNSFPSRWSIIIISFYD